MKTLLIALLQAPVNSLRALLRHGHLLRQLTRRQVLGRYRGSFLGLLWSFLNPLLMLAVYTFVFSVIFKARWGTDGSGSKLEFALTLFAGLCVFQLFSEVITRAPGLVLAHPNYVKKVVFPLEILPASLLGEALFHTLVSLGVLLLGMLALLHHLPWTVVLLPVVLLPMLLLTLGLAWFLAAFGVFVRDVGYSIGILTSVLFFLTPIFYPVSAVPASFQVLLQLNPLAVFVESSRRVLMWGTLPEAGWFAYATGLAVLAYCGGFVFFEKTKRSFADVI